MSAVEEIRIKLESRLGVLEEEIESLRSALSALDAQAADTAEDLAEAVDDRPARTRAAASPVKRARPRNGNGRKPRAPAAAELEQLLAQTGGMSAVELARQTGTDYGEVLARIQELERAGQARAKA